MRHRCLVILATCLPVLFSADVMAEAEYESDYKGEEHRDVKSLSEDDLLELRSGGGWGLAKPAELNGLPGPVHVLEMRDEIGLSADQESEISSIYAEMKDQAVVLGNQLIELETQLDAAFSQGDIDAIRLKDLVSRIADVRGELRYVHLAAHLKTPEVLSEDQVRRYYVLRGYSGDPCLAVPQGHDPEMWKRHNECD